AADADDLDYGEVVVRGRHRLSPSVSCFTLLVSAAVFGTAAVFVTAGSLSLLVFEINSKPQPQG
ncbi:hypothetical protein, partial [Rhodococcus sp. (in: high G+C Gram-positive bacteria)]|uniref:hypothetical protein n=1 Tax=Rhodococcus sp. TaxID=1831 RepID=UPI0025D932F9